MFTLKQRVGARIRLLRKQRGLTQEDVAEKSSVNATYYGRIERGEANVSLDLLAAIAASLETQVAHLVAEDTLMEPERMQAAMLESMVCLSEEDLQKLYGLYQLLFPGVLSGRSGKSLLQDKDIVRLVDQWRKRAARACSPAVPEPGARRCSGGGYSCRGHTGEENAADEKRGSGE